jgi:NADPH:quinone reductase-like Zn-dependent oxidoreductase
MKALQFKEFGSLDRLELVELPAPEPREGEVLIKVEAAAVNPSDVKNVQGRMVGTTLPRIPGRDFSGVVVDGPRSVLGKEVWGCGGDLGYTRDGSHAELLLLPGNAVSEKPGNLSFAQAAAVGVTFTTAYAGLIQRAVVRAGEVVLVTGAAGGVGSAVLQLAHAHGAKLIAVDRKPFRPETFPGLQLLGFINTTERELCAAVKELTAAQGVDVAFDCVGGALFEQVLGTLGRGGRQVAITSVGDRRVSFDLLDFYHRELSLYGVDSRSMSEAASAKLLDQLRPLFERGELAAPAIGTQRPIAEGRALFDLVAVGGAGKAILLPSS